MEDWQRLALVGLTWRRAIVRSRDHGREMVDRSSRPRSARRGPVQRAEAATTREIDSSPSRFALCSQKSKQRYGSPWVASRVAEVGYARLSPPRCSPDARTGAASLSSSEIVRTTDSSTACRRRRTCSTVMSARRRRTVHGLAMSRTCARDGWLYLAVLLDCTRAAWSGGRCPSTMTRRSRLSAVQTAVDQRQPEPLLIHRADEGRRTRAARTRRCSRSTPSCAA